MAEFINPERPPSHDEWRARYEADMARAADIYRDVTDAIRQLEVPAKVTQTGGMCLAIQWDTTDGGYWLLTDIEGPLPWDRRQVTGWALGRYDEEGEVYATVDTEDATVTGAIELILSTLREDIARTTPL